MNALADGIIPLYQRHSGAWDRDRNSRPWPERIWHERVAALLAPGARVLDLGGTGFPVAAYYVERGFRATGIDGAAAQIALCRQRLPAEEWIVADMRGLDLGRTFDAVLAWDSCFHLTPEDQRRMFEVFAAHAAGNAPLLFNTGPRHGEAIGSYGGEPLYHASLDLAEYRVLLAAHGFDVLDHVAEDPAAGGRTVWLARRHTLARF